LSSTAACRLEQDGKGDVMGTGTLVTDASDEVRLRDTADRLETTFRELVDELPDVVFSLDASARFDFVNKKGEEFLGCACDEILGTLLSDHVSPGDRELTKTLMNLDPEAVWDQQMTVLDTGGREKYVRVRCQGRFNEDGDLVGFQGVMRDRTRQRKLEQSLREYQTSLKESEMRYRTLVENIPDMLFSLDASGRFTFLNVQLGDFLGLMVPELLEKPLWGIAAPEYRSLARTILRVEPEEVWDQEMAVVASDGERMWVRIRCKAVLDSDLRVTGFEGVMRDRTARKRLEENLKTARKELLAKIQIIDDLYEHIVQTEKYKAITQHTAEVAHELRQPLAIIGGFARRMLNQLETCENADIGSQRDCFNIIAKEVKRLERILEGFIDFTNHQEVHLQEVDPRVLIREVVHVSKERLKEKDIDIIIDFGDEVDEVYLDPERFGHVIRNLLTNAIEAAPRNGSIQIRTGAFIPSDRARQAGDLESDTYFEMKIVNSGNPIPQEELGQIFDPFYTTKPHGTGLGLTLTKRIVEEHNGSISVTSDDQGTAVSVWIPLQPHEVKASQPA
jgi:PAS domain S-box-containing protein